MRRTLWGLVLVAASACSDGSGFGINSIDSVTVDRIAKVAMRIDADPAAAATFLTEAGLTVAEFDSVLFKIAADSALSILYERARGR